MTLNLCYIRRSSGSGFLKCEFQSLVKHQFHHQLSYYELQDNDELNALIEIINFNYQ